MLDAIERGGGVAHQLTMLGRGVGRFGAQVLDQVDNVGHGKISFPKA
jgi:hypothetical protein